ncbi:hypothetical protein TSOC_002730 [Tetrabaena socialis]|uniref:Protein kinase domain-containing protein n=1 Tax=Tetrabaena socialis TaxID=47790 RepID=A0A2J8ADD8_9CHLO|nr:hypothetical protein TSOC_002730 [Tetrabaena socialis]|eukprot:PNH10527.1 hypothetical protein TSOC_002730 [Tetrabaena socialis]
MTPINNVDPRKGVLLPKIDTFDPKTSKCLIGKGKTGSYVFTSDCIQDFVRHGKLICENLYENYLKRNCLDSEKYDVGTKPPHNLVLKINDKADETRMEIAANNKIHSWLSKRSLLRLSALHPTISTISVFDDANNMAADLVALRPMDGDVSRLTDLTAQELLLLTKNALTVLYIIHEEKYMHLDIKPPNILYTSRKVGEERLFAVADYGILESMVGVHSFLARKSYSGTLGYMSPLLLENDDANQVFPKFSRIFRKTRGSELCTEAMRALFYAKRKEFNLQDPREQRGTPASLSTLERLFPKIDLHSLGLTLYDLVDRQTGLTDAERKLFYDLMYSLIFYSDKEMGVVPDKLNPAIKTFSTTFDAAQVVCALSRSGCADIDEVGEA